MKINEPKCKFIISRYKENVHWIKDYTDNYVIYNKGEPLSEKEYNYIQLDNIGNNQYDIFHYFYNNYEDLPELMLFVQAYPFDHCDKEQFEKKMYNEEFTPIEHPEKFNHTGASKADVDGGYMEINNNWYIAAHNGTHGLTCKYKSFDEFMNKVFKNYVSKPFIRFTPGSQYLIESKQAYKYPKYFWKFMMDELPKNNMTEGHIIERALYEILTGDLKIEVVMDQNE